MFDPINLLAAITIVASIAGWLAATRGNDLDHF
jgi:hypothetical protein